ncbi:MAG: error-prone DNA polymerase [Bdellovibrionota bacterium]
MVTLTEQGYAELCCKTNHSFLQGASRPEELIEQAARLNLNALAITDRDGVYGMPKAYRAVKNHPKLKLIVGAELSLEGKPPLILLAQNRKAYGLMCRLISASHEGREKGKASLQWNRFVEMMESPHRDGLVALAQDGQAVQYGALKDLFGSRLYLPLSRLFDGFDVQRTRRVLEISRIFDLKIIATNDVHYHMASRKVLQDVLTAVREQTTLSGAGRKLHPNAERHLKSADEMRRLFADLPEAITNTLVVAESCAFSPSELRYCYPSEWIPQGETAQSYLVKLVWEGAKKRYPQGIPPQIVTQIEHELKTIDELKFADYFLTIWEIVEFARAKKILCQGRGSAANSVVCYCLGITAIDPSQIEMLFERFISAERGEPPDIDVDFEHERREEVIQHIYERYGRDRAAMVAALVAYRSRSASREVSKVLEVDLEQVRKAENPSPQVGLARKIAGELYGFPRHLSIHSGGFTLSRDPLIETVPIEPARMEGRTVVQWDKDDLDAIGLLKVDILALGMLTAIRKTCDYIGGLSLDRIPRDDARTYEMMQKADTVGVFQIESRAQMNMLGRLLPKNFYDLVIQVAIVRPGPIVGKMVHPYLRRRRGIEPVEFPDPRLVPILKRTLGVPLFQEQVMRIAIKLVNFTPGEADELRRAIGAWRSTGSIEKLGKKLKAGLLSSGLPQEWVDRVFEQIKGFAEYGFPESHAASFALLAYASSYLRCHYPAEFTCALLNSQPMGFYSSNTLINDARRHGVQVLALHPNASEWDCTLEGKALRIGWRVVKGLGEAEAACILEERKKRPFQSLLDFCARVRLKPQVLSRLAMGDAFSCFGFDQRHALWEVLAHEAFLRPDPGGQFHLFQNALLSQESQGDPMFAPLDFDEAIRADYASYRLSVRGHPMQALRAKLKNLPKITTSQARRFQHGQLVTIAGLAIIRQRPPTAKGTVFSTLEDEEGFLDLILHKSTHERFRALFDEHTFLVARGVIQRDTHSVSVLVKHLRPVFRV